MIFSQKIKALRKASGLSQTELAKALKVNIGSVSGWERGKVPKYGNMLLLAEYFKMSIDGIFGRQDFFLWRS